MYKSQIINRDLKYTMNVERKLKMVGGIWLDMYISSFKSFQRREECRMHWDWYTLDDGVDQDGGQCNAVEDGVNLEVSNTFNSGF